MTDSENIRGEGDLACVDIPEEWGIRRDTANSPRIKVCSPKIFGMNNRD